MFGLFKKKKENDGINEDFFALAKDIIDTSDKVTKIYIEKRQQLKLADAGSDEVNTYYEFIYFYLHYLNRECFTLGGKYAQIKIYEVVARYVYEIIKIKSQDDEFGDIFIRVFAEGINDAELAYAKCDGWVNNEKLESSVFFEATRRVLMKNTEEEILIAADLIYTAMNMLNMNEKAKTLLELN